MQKLTMGKEAARDAGGRLPTSGYFRLRSENSVSARLEDGLSCHDTQETNGKSAFRIDFRKAHR